MALERAAEHEDKQVRMLVVDYDRVDSMAKAKAKAGAKVSRREKNGRREIETEETDRLIVSECAPQTVDRRRGLI